MRGDEESKEQNPEEILQYILQYPENILNDIHKAAFARVGDLIDKLKKTIAINKLALNENIANNIAAINQDNIIAPLSALIRAFEVQVKTPSRGTLLTNPNKKIDPLFNPKNKVSDLMTSVELQSIFLELKAYTQVLQPFKKDEDPQEKLKAVVNSISKAAQELEQNKHKTKFNPITRDKFLTTLFAVSIVGTLPLVIMTIINKLKHGTHNPLASLEERQSGRKGLGAEKASKNFHAFLGQHKNEAKKLLKHDQDAESLEQKSPKNPTKGR